MAYQTTLQNITNPTPYDVGISCNEGLSIWLVATIEGKGLAVDVLLPTSTYICRKGNAVHKRIYEGYES